mgnify:CR=1 FL=1
MASRCMVIRKKIPISILFLGAILFLLAQPLKSSVRALIKNMDTTTDTISLDQMGSLIESSISNIQSNPDALSVGSVAFIDIAFKRTGTEKWQLSLT